MALNVPTTDSDRFSFGPGVLSLVGITQTEGDVGDADLNDVGAVRSGATFAVTRTKLDVFQGSPRTLIRSYVTEETAQLTVNGLEWDLSNLALALGAGTASEDDPDVITFGGDMNLSNVAVKFVHELPSGYTLTLRIWKAQGNGDVTVTFGDDSHEIPYVFNAVNALTGWDVTGAGGLGTDARLFRLELDRS